MQIITHVLRQLFCAILFILITLGLVSPAYAQSPLTQVEINEAEIVEGLARPAVVSILHYVQVNATTPDFDIDPDTLAISLGDGDPYTVNDSYYIVTSGVLVSQDGHIFTTAHGVSDAAIELAIVTDVVEEKILTLSGGDVENEQEYTDEELDQALIALINEVRENSDIQIIKDVRVARSSIATGEKEYESVIEGVFERARHADLLYSNDAFFSEGYDLALIQISGEGLPALSIASEVPPSGAMVYALQSASAEEVTAAGFSKGLYTTDLELSESRDIVVRDTITGESSGGPLLNAQGEVVGILSTLPEARMASASELINVVNRLQITTGSGVYAQTFLRGIEEARNLRCAEAHDTFEVARSASSVYGGAFDPSVFIDRCEAVRTEIEQQKSLFGSLLGDIGGEGILNSILIGATVLLGIILLVIAIWFARRVRRNRRSLQKMPSVEGTTIHDQAPRPVMDSMGGNRAKPLAQAGKSTDKPEVLDRMRTTLDSDAEIKPLKRDQAVRITPLVESQRRVGTDNHEQKIPAVGEIPADDEEKLAALWPSKYTTEENQPLENERIEEEDVAHAEVVETSLEEREEVSEEVDPALLQYILDTRKLGFNDETVVAELEKAGWEPSDIKRGFANLDQ